MAAECCSAFSRPGSQRTTSSSSSSKRKHASRRRGFPPHMKRTLCLLICGLLGLHGFAAERFSPVIVRVECQMVIVPQANALDLMPDLQDEAKSAAAVARLALMVRNGTATLVADLIARGAPNTKLVCETVEETRYATEYE